jgi:hypothetical protein
LDVVARLKLRQHIELDLSHVGRAEMSFRRVKQWGVLPGPADLGHVIDADAWVCFVEQVDNSVDTGDPSPERDGGGPGLAVRRGVRSPAPRRLPRCWCSGPAPLPLRVTRKGPQLRHHLALSYGRHDHGGPCEVQRGRTLARSPRVSAQVPPGRKTEYLRYLACTLLGSHGMNANRL